MEVHLQWRAVNGYGVREYFAQHQERAARRREAGERVFLLVAITGHGQTPRMRELVAHQIAQLPSWVGSTLVGACVVAESETARRGLTLLQWTMGESLSVPVFPTLEAGLTEAMAALQRANYPVPEPLQRNGPMAIWLNSKHHRRRRLTIPPNEVERRRLLSDVPNISIRPSSLPPMATRSLRESLRMLASQRRARDSQEDDGQ